MWSAVCGQVVRLGVSQLLTFLSILDRWIDLFLYCKLWLGKYFSACSVFLNFIQGICLPDYSLGILTQKVAEIEPNGHQRNCKFLPGNLHSFSPVRLFFWPNNLKTVMGHLRPSESCWTVILCTPHHWPFGNCSWAISGSHSFLSFSWKPLFSRSAFCIHIPWDPLFPFQSCSAFLTSSQYFFYLNSYFIILGAWDKKGVSV